MTNSPFDSLRAIDDRVAGGTRWRRASRAGKDTHGVSEATSGVIQASGKAWPPIR